MNVFEDRSVFVSKEINAKDSIFKKEGCVRMSCYVGGLYATHKSP